MFILSSSSFSDIKTDLEQFIASNATTYKVLDAYEGSAKTMIIDLLAGFASFLQYKYTVARDEAYLYSAKLKSSIYLLASQLGYRVNRNLAPSVEFKYRGSDPFTITSGFEIAKYAHQGEDFSVVYFGSAKRLNYGDLVDGYVGVFNVISGDFSGSDFAKTVKVECPLTRRDTTVDNTKVRLFINNQEEEVSHVLEDFVILNKVIDFTSVHDTSELWIHNSEKNYGRPVVPTDEFRIEYLECFGYLSSLNSDLTSNLDIINNQFKLERISSFGFDQDSIDKVRTIAPLYSTTLRRMVTHIDHDVLTRSYPGILDTNHWVYTYDRTSLIIYYIAEGSTLTPREFTDTEKATYESYLEQFKLLDLKIDAQPPEAVHVILIAKVKYDCNFRDYEDYDNALETYLSNEVNAIIDEQQLKFNAVIDINQIMVKIARIQYNNLDIVREISFKQIVDGEIVDLTEESVINLERFQYFWIERSLELTCF